jgi:5-dehydro-2-deoxygluconokinase
VKALRALTGGDDRPEAGADGLRGLPGAIPARLEDGIRGPGFPVDVYNTLGAGDAFMAGFLRGWLKGEPIETCCAGRTPAARSPSRGCSVRPNIRRSANCSTSSRTDLPGRFAATPTSITSTGPRRGGRSRHADGARHRPSQPVRGDGRQGSARPRDRSALQALAVEATARVAAGRPGYGMLLDGTYGTRRCSTPPIIRSGSAGRSNCPDRGRSTSRAAATSARTWSVAGDADGQVPLLLSPGRRPTT